MDKSAPKQPPVYAEVCLYVSFKDEAERIATALRESGVNARITVSPLVSYQGGDHGPNPGDHPKDWGKTMPCSEKASDVARDGDILVCIGVSDRYGYVQERGLKFHNFGTPEQFFEDIQRVLV